MSATIPTEIPIASTSSPDAQTPGSGVDASVELLLHDIKQFQHEVQDTSPRLPLPSIAQAKPKSAGRNPTLNAYIEKLRAQLQEQELNEAKLRRQQMALKTRNTDCDSHLASLLTTIGMERDFTESIKQESSLKQFHSSPSEELHSISSRLAEHQENIHQLEQAYMRDGKVHPLPTSFYHRLVSLENELHESTKLADSLQKDTAALEKALKRSEETHKVQVLKTREDYEQQPLALSEELRNKKVELQVLLFHANEKNQVLVDSHKNKTVVIEQLTTKLVQIPTEDKITHLKNTVIQKKTDLDELKSENQRLTRLLSLREKELQKAKTVVKTSGIPKVLWEHDKAGLEEQLQQLLESKQELERSIAPLKEQITSLRYYRAGLGYQATNATASVVSDTSTAIDVPAEIFHALETNVKLLRAQLAEKEDSIVEQGRAIEKLERQMELLKAAKKSEAKRIQQSGTQEDARIAELRKKLHFVENEYKEIETTLNQQNQDLQSKLNIL